jgi:two-component system chemotaxis sensor kinase CheA
VSDIHEKLLAAFQVEHKEHLQAVRAMLDELARRGFDVKAFDFAEAHRRVHSLKGAARAVGLRPIETLAHRLETLMSRCQSGALPLDREAAAAVHLAFDSIEDYVTELETVAEPAEPREALATVERFLGIAPTEDRDDAGGAVAEPAQHPARASMAARVVETARVDVDSLDVVLKHAGEILTENLHHERIATELRKLQQNLEDLERDAARVRSQPRPAAGVKDDSLGAIVDHAQAISRLQGDAAWRLRRLGRQLYQDARALRIVPAESVFGGVGKTVRDLARAEGKQVEIDVEGLDTRADRQVLQALKDPVTHLLRNAVTHGIETSDVRAKRGKLAVGRIGFKIATQRNRLVIRVEDDGYGLDGVRIIKEAQRRGLLPADAPAPDTIKALTAILLQPGFTTVRKVTEIAGRGIGLSVVDKAVRQLQGSFDLAPGERAGTVATVSVPLAVASSRLLLVQCKDNTYGIPAHSVERLCRLATEDIATVKDKPMIVFKGEDDPISLVGLAQLLGHADTTVVGDGKSVHVVLLKSDAARLGVAVDAFVAVQDSVIHDLDAALPELILVMGGVILADGSVSTVLNPAALIKAAQETKRPWSFDAHVPVERRAAPLILVVDDSITTRTLEKSILEAKGFRVRLSVDGIDALEQLRQERADLVIVDIEMPRMDGFELLHAMKGDSRLADIPVVLVTSRDNAPDRRKGLALGAQAYIVKQRFDQRQLLETIDQIL